MVGERRSPFLEQGIRPAPFLILENIGLAHKFADPGWGENLQTQSPAELSL